MNYKLTILLILATISIAYVQDIYPWDSDFPLPTQNFNPDNAFLNTSQEWVDLASGNLMIVEPLVHYEGRNGLDLDILLTYNSGFWRAEGEQPPLQLYGGAPSLIYQWCGLGWDICMGELHIISNYYESYGQPHTQHNYKLSYINIPSAEIKSRVIQGELAGDNDTAFYIENNPDWRIIQYSNSCVVISPSGIKYYFERWMKRKNHWNDVWEVHTQQDWVYFLTSIMDNNGNYIPIKYTDPNQNGFLGTEYMEHYHHQSEVLYARARLLYFIEDMKDTWVKFHYHDREFQGYYDSTYVTPELDSIQYFGFQGDGNLSINTIKFEHSMEQLTYVFNSGPYERNYNLLREISFLTSGSLIRPPKKFEYELDHGNLIKIAYPTAKYNGSSICAGYKEIGYNLVTSYGWSSRPMHYQRVSYISEVFWENDSNRIEFYFGNNEEANQGWDENDIRQSSAAVHRSIYGVSPAAIYRKTKVKYTKSGDYDIYYFLDKDDVDDNLEHRVSLWGTCYKIEHYTSSHQLLSKEEYGYDLSIEGQNIYEIGNPPLPWAYKQLRGELHMKGNAKVFTRYDNYTKYNQWKTKTEYGFINSLEWGPNNSNPSVDDFGSDKRTTSRSFLWESNFHYNWSHIFLIDRIDAQSTKDNGNNVISQVEYEYDSPGYNDYYDYYSMYPEYPPMYHNTQGQYRGNMTKFKRGLKEDSQWDWITTHYKYDICGNIVRRIGPLGYETSYRYDVRFPDLGPLNIPNCYQYAFMRKIAKYLDNDSICEGALWYKDAGLIARYFGPNSSENWHGWMYKYCQLSRLLNITAPFETQTAHWSKYFIYSYAMTANNVNVMTIRTTKDDDPTVPQECYTNQYYLYDYLGNLFQYQRQSPYGSDSSWQINYYYNEKGLKDTVSKQFSCYNPYAGGPPQICGGNMVNGYTQYEYDAINRKTSLTHPPGTNEQDRIHYSYANNEVTITDENDKQRRFTYDAYGRISKVELILGDSEYTTEYQYDALGNLILVAKNSGSYIITYMYDSMGRLIQKNDPNSGITEYIYDDAGNLRFIQDANHAAGGDWVYKKYDAIGRLIEEGEIYDVNPGRSDANNPNYPAIGSWRLKKHYDYSYNGSTNPKGNLVMEEIVGDKTAYDYRAIYSYDKRDRITSKTVYANLMAIGGLTTFYEYDAQDNLIKTGYPDEEATIYHLNGLGLCDTLVNIADEWLARIHYSENERPSNTEVKNYSTSVSYYPRDWVHIINSAPLIHIYTYDSIGNVVSDYVGGYTAVYTYDDLYRLESEMYSAVGKNISYTYDFLHNRTEMDEDGRITEYNYTQGTSRLIKVGGYNCINDANGNMTKFKNYNNYYNYRNELMKRSYTQLIPDIPIEEVRTELDALGLLAELESSVSITDVDVLDAVASSDVLDTLADIGKILRDNYSYLYDGNGNRSKMIHNSAVTRYVCDQSGRVTFETDNTPNLLKNPNFENGSNWTPWCTHTPQGSCTWTVVSDTVKGGFYAIKGISKTDDWETFIQKVQLDSCPQPFVISAYIKTKELMNGIKLQVDFYDETTFLGCKYSTLISGTNDWVQVILPIYSSDIPTGTDRMDVFVRKFAGIGTVWIDGFRLEGGTAPSPKDVKYLYVNNTHLAKINALGDPYYYHCNALGTPEMITDKDGSVVRGNTYYAFGEELLSSGEFTNTHRFTGKEYEDTGIYYFGARYYMPAIGRFITPDPLGTFEKKDPSTINPYVYCTNNPLRYVDPNGLWRWETVKVGGWQVIKGTVGASVGSTFITAGVATTPVGGVGVLKIGGGLLLLGYSGFELGQGWSNLALGIFTEEKPIPDPIDETARALLGKAGVIGNKTIKLLLDAYDPKSIIDLLVLLEDINEFLEELGIDQNDDEQGEDNTTTEQQSDQNSKTDWKRKQFEEWDRDILR